jgi:hypothetical protein
MTVASVRKRLLAIVAAAAFLFPLQQASRAQLIERSPASIRCSKEADARGLHGEQRRAFRAQCKASFSEQDPIATPESPSPNPADAQNRLPPCPSDKPSSEWTNCHSIYNDAKGNLYVGDFKYGKKSGQGTYTYANGNKYVGEFKDGRQNGKGTFTSAKVGNYFGEFRDGKPTGQGTYTYTNGDKFVGSPGEHGNGHGIYTYANGDKFVGQHKDGIPNGQGTLTFSDGSKYVGEFKDGQFHGQGTRSDANGSIISAGIWLDGRFVGTAPDQETVQMDRSGGVYVVPVRFNDTITLDAVVDSGASDVSVPADIVLTLMRTKTVTQDDFLGKQTYVLADGSKVPSQQFRIRSLKVGNKTIENVVASIASVEGTILLGQSFLSKFKSWSVDNEKHTLVLR